MQWRWRAVEIDVYIKFIVLLVLGFLIYSSVINYRYNLLSERGLKTIQRIHKKDISPEDYSAGFISSEGDFKRARALLPSRDEAYYYLATLYIDYINSEFTKKLRVTEDSGLTEDIAEREAIANLERATQINPYNVDALLSLAWLYEYAGNKDSADRLVAYAETLSPGKIRIMSKILEWAVLRKDMAKVKKLLEDIFTINPGMLSTSLNIIWRVEQDYEELRELVPAKRRAREIFARFLKSKKMDESAKAEEEYARDLAE